MTKTNITKINNFFEKKQIVSYLLSILIFWIHCSSFSNYNKLIENTWIEALSIFLQKIITPVAVPLFLVLSGALFFRDYTSNKYTAKIRNRFFSLVIPFFLWNIINMTFNIFATIFLSKYFIGRELFVFSIQNLFLGIFHYKYNIVCWFIFALIFFSLIAPLINFFISNKCLGIITIILFLVGSAFGIGLPVPVFFNQSCIIYYLVGAYIGKHYFFILNNKKNNTIIFLSTIFLVLGLFYQGLYLYNIINFNILINEIILIICSFATWFLFDFLLKNITLKNFMKHSFWVYALHINVSAILAKLLYIVLPKQGYISIINFILTTILTLGSIEFLCQCTKKCCFPLYKLLSGNR